MQEIQKQGFDSWVRKIPWQRKWKSTLILLPGKFHRQRSLARYSPWGVKESNTTEATERSRARARSLSLSLSHTHTHTHTHHTLI